jgi:hypothetical protein
LGIPIGRGRDFREEDEAGGAAAVIVNEGVARHCFPGKDPIGQRIEIGPQGIPMFSLSGGSSTNSTPPLTAGNRVGYVVGVAGSSRDGVSMGYQLPGIV